MHRDDDDDDDDDDHVTYSLVHAREMRDDISALGKKRGMVAWELRGNPVLKLPVALLYTYKPILMLAVARKLEKVHVVAASKAPRADENNGDVELILYMYPRRSFMRLHHQKANDPIS